MWVHSLDLYEQVSYNWVYSQPNLNSQPHKPKPADIESRTGMIGSYFPFSYPDKGA